MPTGKMEVVIGHGNGGTVYWTDDLQPHSVPNHAIQKAIRAFVAVLDEFSVQYRISAQSGNWDLGTWSSGKQFPHPDDEVVESESEKHKELLLKLDAVIADVNTMLPVVVGIMNRRKPKKKGRRK